MTRVLCYSPYNRWLMHAQWEMTILRALKARGADVRYVLCDGLYTDCDVFWEAIEGPRPANACQMCQATVTEVARDLGMDYRWLGRHLSPEEPREARRWVQSLQTAELRGARYGEWDIADWITGSVHSHLRRSTLDLADPEVERVYRSYLYSGLVAAFALDRLLEDQRPDVMLQFNGRQSSTRVAFELARARGIRVICHERGPRKETLKLTEDAQVANVASHVRFWADWAGVPLSADELRATGELLLAREQGVGMNWKAFSPGPQHPDDVRDALGLDPARPTWVLYTSSDDEIAAEAGWNRAFATQFDWIEQTVAYAARHPAIELVIRVHPNTGGARAHGANTGLLDRFVELSGRLPDNVKMVMPDAPMSSYALMEVATAGLVYHSTVALELACKGRHTVVAGGNMVEGMPFVRTVESAATYDALLDALAEVPAGTVDAGVRRTAWRFAYGLFYRSVIDFPLVKMGDPLRPGTPQWSGDADLAPGRDPGLDRCAAALLEGAPVTPPPGEAELARTTADEDAFFAGPAPRRFTALAFAEELIADHSLLAAWGSIFSAEDDATLVIHAPGDTVDELIRAVAAAGLDADGGPDLIALDGELDGLADVNVVFSRGERPGVLPHVPRYSDESLAALRFIAELAMY